MNQETARKPEKVLFVVTKSNFGGAQRYIFDIATNLRQEYEVAVLSGAAQDSAIAGPLIGMLNQAGIRTIFAPQLQRDVRIRADIGTFFFLLATFRAERPDVVHLNSSKAGGLGAMAARLAGIRRIIFTSHGLAYDEPRFAAARLGIFLLTWLTFLLCHEVICISESTAVRAKRLPFCARRVSLVYNGLRPGELLDRDNARAQLSTLGGGIPTNVPWIGTIAELVPNKGLFYTLRTCEILRDSGRRFVFLIIGSGELQEDLARTIKKRGLAEHVRLVGYVPGASRLLKALDIFSLTSKKEGLPYVLLEAGYAGLPVIATDIPGIRDIVESGVSGALCPLHDPELCADSVAEILDNPALAERLGMNLRGKVGTTFNFETMLAKTVAIYQARPHR